MASTIYTNLKKLLGKGLVAFPSDTFKAALLTSSHTPSAAHAVLADVVANEVSGTGYTAGGATLSSVTWTASGTKYVFDATDIQWTGATILARYVAVYKVGTVDSQANPLICLLDFGEEKGVTGGTFTVEFAALGMLNLD